MSSSNTPFTPPTTEAGKLSWLRLIRSSRIGPTTFYRLMTEHGSAEAALEALPALAAKSGATEYRPCSASWASKELQEGHKTGATPLFYGSAEYPLELLQIPDAPPVLWSMGDIGLYRRPMVALVGARNASSLGLRMANRLARELTANGIAVASGLARGIDTAAHQGALQGGTVAVLAGGLGQIYPAENEGLAQSIRENGALLSEVPPLQAAQARHFPARNRIISGLSLGIVVVEAAERSGSMITARMALDQGREVMAVPGHPVDPRAAGCNLMIREGSTLVRNVDDILEALTSVLEGARHSRALQPKPVVTAAPQRPNRLPPSDQLPPAPNGGQIARAMAALSRPPQEVRRLILARLSPTPLSEDQLSRDLDLPSGRLASELLALELEGEIERRPGGFLTKSA